MLALVSIDVALTVGEELNKVASNVATGRNAIGIHGRSDYTQSLLLGEQVAIGILKEMKACYNEPVRFTFTRFDGIPATI